MAVTMPARKRQAINSPKSASANASAARKRPRFVIGPFIS